jgi:class 3 adenylate cyclase
MPDQPLTSAALFDTRSEFARDLPLELIAAWMNSERTPATAQELLLPFLFTGTVVVSDSAGLTRLTWEREPLEVMALINEPKELVHEYGTAIGGRAMGVWTADNTSMFYPDTVSCDQIAAMLLALQQRIRAECKVQIGIGVHSGSFFILQDALYGDQANHIECLAEDRTAGGEIVLTQTFAGRLSPAFQTVARTQIPCDFTDGLRLLEGPPWTAPTSGNRRYPLPFSTDFYDCLPVYRERTEALNRFRQTRTVLLVERAPVESADCEYNILAEMTSAAIARVRGNWLLGSTGGVEIKTAGSLSIYVFETAAQAWTFSIRLRAVLESDGIRTRSGIATGDVLLFDLDSGGHEISGSPVNIASKIAQDHGEYGSIYLSGTLPDNREPALDAARVSFLIAGNELTAWVV